jgi:hypothetical protein
MERTSCTELNINVGSSFVQNNFPDTNLEDTQVMFKVFYSDKREKSFVVEPKIIREDNIPVICFPDGSYIKIDGLCTVTGVEVKEAKDGNKYVQADAMVVVGDCGFTNLKIAISPESGIADKGAAVIRKTLKSIIDSGVDKVGVLGTYKSGGIEIKKLWELPHGKYTGLTLGVTKGQYPKYYFEVDGTKYQVPNREAQYLNDLSGTYSLSIPMDAEIESGSVNGHSYKKYSKYSFIEELDYDSIAEYC